MHAPYNLEITDSCSKCRLRAEKIFCQLSPTALEALEALKFTSVYPAGSLLFVQGQAPRGIFILCSGRVKVSTCSNDGKTLILKIANEGDVLGLSSAILERPYEVSAETVEPSQVNFVKREDFLRFLSEYGDACLHAAQQLSESYHSAQKEIRSLGLSQSASEKLARLLLEWADGGTSRPEGDIRVKLFLTHEEIAQMIGSSRETVTRLLSDFKKRDIIQIKGSTLLIRDRDQLEEMLNS
ncbi:MAG: Crp/Fnr family transcriptional regulator [Thermoanaerobaculia bacterium]